MKRIFLLAQALVALFSLQSCIQDEPLNAECDIIAVDSIWYNENQAIFKTKPNIQNDKISFTVLNKEVDRSALNPLFILSEGTRLTANENGEEIEGNGITRDFTKPQIYTTHSQDGKWSKKYTITFAPPLRLKHMGFENYRIDNGGRYQEWYEIDTTDAVNPIRDYWSSGNPGFGIANAKAEIADFPTTVFANGVKGRGLKLTTRETGWKSLKMPIAAGNLFIGTFNASAAAVSPTNALKATKFGLPLLDSIPIRLEGYYKYKAGEEFRDGNYKLHPEMHDTADIYAVVYEIATRSEMAADKTKTFVALDGSNVLTSERIVLMARIDKPIEFEGDMADLADSKWNHFVEEFKPMNGKTIDEKRLADDGYAIAIVLTSSRQGAYFKGAKNSTLYVDEIKLVYKSDI